MDLPKLQDQEIDGKRVLVRVDLDVGEDVEKGKRRLKLLIPTLSLLAENTDKITLIGHRGRPKSRQDKELSLRPVAEKLQELCGNEITPTVLENLRFDPREEENNEEFARQLADMADVYINEAFAASHRAHTSIVGIPKLLPHAAGLRFAEEVENLEKVRSSSKKPVVFIVSGIKDDKLGYIKDIEKIADKILIGGRLPESIHDDSPLRKDSKIVVANLMPDKEDITISSIEQFETEIEKAGAIVISGPIGKFEDETHKQGTERVFSAVAESSAFKVAGGGETESALETLGIIDKFDWVSVGGGAMLEFLSKGTLPGIEALLH